LDRLTHLEQDRRKVFAELDRARSQYPEPFDNGKALTALISSAARRRNVHMAGMIWAWMDVAHVAKNTFHYNSMISATEKSRNYRQALALLREMEQRNIPKNEVT
jgi:pentatricopeptide repeat protein